MPQVFQKKFTRRKQGWITKIHLRRARSKKLRYRENQNKNTRAVPTEQYFEAVYDPKTRDVLGCEDVCGGYVNYRWLQDE